jgi:hypothetical protein
MWGQCPVESLGTWSQGEWGGRGMWHAWETRENYSRFWWEILKERGLLEDRGVDGRMGSERILGTLAGRILSGFKRLRIGVSGGPLWMRWWTFGFWHHEVSVQSKVCWPQWITQWYHNNTSQPPLPLLLLVPVHRCTAMLLPPSPTFLRRREATTK